MKEKVLLIYGGKSVEHDISIITALQAMKNFPSEFEYVAVYIDKNGQWWTADNLADVNVYSDFKAKAKNKFQVTIQAGTNEILIKKRKKYVFFQKILTVLNCCHGNIGEDGSLQGLFKACNIPQTCCGVTSSALCMDKAFMKDILKANSIKSPEYVYFDRCAYENLGLKVVKNLSLPLIVKPANLGSSIGISVCKTKDDLKEAIELAFQFDDKILVEKLVENLKEFNCACFKFKDEIFVSNVKTVKNESEIYTFQDKYLSNSTTSLETEKNLAKKIQSLTKKVYKLFDCQGVSRVDFLFDDQELYVNEVNSIPGSLAFYLFKDIPFKDLIACLINQSLEKKNEKIVTFESNALEIFAKAQNSCKK